MKKLSIIHICMCAILMFIAAVEALYNPVQMTTIEAISNGLLFLSGFFTQTSVISLLVVLLLCVLLQDTRFAKVSAFATLLVATVIAALFLQSLHSLVGYFFILISSMSLIIYSISIFMSKQS